MNAFLAKSRLVSSPATEGSGGSTGSAPGGTGGASGSASPASTPSVPVSDGGPSSTPPGAGTSSPSSESVKVASGDGANAVDPFEWASGFGEDVIEVPVQVTGEVKPQVPEVVVPPPAGEVQPPAEIQPPVAQAEPQVPQGQRPLLDPAEPAQMAALFESSGPELISAIAAEHFQLTREEAEAFEADPVGSLPKLAATVFVKTMKSFMNVQAKMIPAMVARHLQVVQRNSQSQGRFYSRWKDAGVDPILHGEVVMRLGRAYRAANPTAPLEQMVEELGPWVIAAAKIQPPVARVAAGNGVRPPPASPFVPAGGAPPGQTQLEEVNPFASPEGWGE